MAMHTYDKEKMIRTIDLVCGAIPSHTQIWVNVGILIRKHLIFLEMQVQMELIMSVGCEKVLIRI